MPIPALNWKVTGAAGEGIKSTGLLFSKTCLRHGLSTFDYTDYPSLIRGGHNTYQVKAAQDKVYSQEKFIDVLLCFNENGLKFHQDELHEHSLVLVDLKDNNIDASQYAKLPIVDVPFYQLAADAGVDRVMANNVALGVSVYLFQLELTILDQVIEEIFGSKGVQVVADNQKAAKAGYDYATKNVQPLPHIKVTKQPQKEPYALTGNDALALGAIAGGLKAYIAYPMTPSSSILHILAEMAEPAQLLVKHAEDEIGVINMALGASFTGVRAAVGTSGGGFCYMTEAVGLAGVAEIPIVFFECQRPGPALGMPTWTAQADLLFAIHASQDEFPRIVVTPGDVYEAFELSRQAFQWAEDFQVPVIVLSDKHLSESASSMAFPQTAFQNAQTSFDRAPQLAENGFYPRYRLTQTGVSPRTIPGQPNGFHIANSYEADEYGMAVEDSQPRIQQMDKRFAKVDLIKKVIPNQYYFGSDHPQITFISFGSTKTAIQAGVQRLLSEGIDAAQLSLNWVWPFPVEPVIEAIQKSQNPVIVEGNKTNQLAKLIRQETGIDVYHKRTKYDGRPFYPSEIVQYAHEILNH